MTVHQERQQVASQIADRLLDLGMPMSDAVSLASELADQLDQTVTPNGFRPNDADRCTNRRCGHFRSAHTGRELAGTPMPTGCGVVICGCEQFRAEADR